MEETKMLCPACLKKLHKVTGFSIPELKNGGIEELGMAVVIWRKTKKETGISINQSELAEKMKGTVKEALKEILKEKEIETLEHRIEKQEDEWRQKLIEQEREAEERYKEKIDRLSEENQSLNKTVTRLETMMEAMPVRSGGVLQGSLTTLLKRHFPQDEIVEASKGKKEIDITQKITEENKPLGKVLVECKNTSSFSNAWITEAKTHMKRENTEFCIIGTKTMPREERLSPLGVYKDGVFITEPENVVWAMAYYRLALIRNSKDIQTREKEMASFKKSENEMKKFHEKFMKIIGRTDFKEVYELCKEISDDSNQIRKVVDDAHDKITNKTVNINTLVDNVVRHHSSLENEFSNLFKEAI